MNARLLATLELAAPLASAVLLLLALASVWSARVPYPFDLEWMEGGMLAHAWRISHGLPLYIEPSPDFVPYIYPPGYSLLLASAGGLFGLSPMLGRIISLLGTLAAACAISFVVARQAAPRDPDSEISSVPAFVPAFIAAVAFLGTYPQTGAFFDLVRPDGLLIGLIAWSVALGLERDKRAPIAAGFLLFLAFLTKHNAAILGFPLALGIAWRDGWREAARFTAAAAVPALLTVAFLQWKSGGLFLEYLLVVPRSHPSFSERIWPGTLQELGTPMPFALGALCAAALWLGMHGQQTLPLPITTFVPVGAGIVAGTFGTYIAPHPDSGLYNVPSAVAFFAFGAVPVAVLLYVIGATADRRAGREQGPIVSWRFIYGMSLAAVALATSAVMRAHNGGFLNVHIQLFWMVAVGFGVVLERMTSAFPTPGVRASVSMLGSAQLLWSVALLDESKLVPTDADRDAGERMVAAARAADGDVLSPFAAWIPVYAGKPPSLHYMGLWDLEYRTGPFYDRRDAIDQAIASHRWALVLGGNQKFGYGLQEHYHTVETLIEEKDKVLMPKTGWRARPNRIMEPTRP